MYPRAMGRFKNKVKNVLVLTFVERHSAMHSETKGRGWRRVRNPNLKLSNGDVTCIQSH